MIVYRPGNYSLFGTLEAVDGSGIVLRSSVQVSWGELNAEGRQKRVENRMLPEFLPWHTIGGFRPLEPEEREEHGLE